MKQFINFRILSFALILLQLTFFTACKDDDGVSELRLDRAAIQIKEGSEGILKVESGSGEYRFSFSADGYATAYFRDNLIHIKTQKYGKVVMTVSDSQGHTATLDVVITSKVLNTTTPRFVWGGTIELNKANGWGLTVYSNRIAISNVQEKIQYILSWEGDLSVGAKSAATMKVVESSNEPQIIELAGLEILQIKENRYSIVFSTAEKTGELVFLN